MPRLLGKAADGEGLPKQQVPAMTSVLSNHGFALTRMFAMQVEGRFAKLV
jgi:hypothetical protein